VFFKGIFSFLFLLLATVSSVQARVVLIWDANPGKPDEVQYNVYLCEPQGYRIQIPAGKATAAVLGGLQPGITYTIYVTTSVLRARLRSRLSTPPVRIRQETFPGSLFRLSSVNQWSGALSKATHWS
jgi:hypothetical protein